MAMGGTPVVPEPGAQPQAGKRETRVLLTADLTDDALDILHGAVEITPGGMLRFGRIVSTEELTNELQGYDVLIVGYEQVTAELMDACPELKLIASIRGGPEANVSIDAATERGIPVLFTLGRTQHAVAEYAFAQMLALARNLPLGDRLIRERVITSDVPQASERDVIWLLPEGSDEQKIHRSLRGSELFGKTLGLVGLGNIGEEVARLAHAFGMRVIVSDPYVSEERAAEHGVTLVSLPDLMRNADIISLHARITPETIGLIGPDEFALMKPTALLINNARAALLDEAALIDALVHRKIGGAALDVFHKEPLGPDYPLIGLDNVILTPHLAGSSHEIPQHHSRMVAQDVVNYLNGTVTMPRVKNKEVFESSAFPLRGGTIFG
ncbi:MAG: 2-hydroxyacid dehydrogenase [Thermomicrobiales bacterium]